MNTRMELGVVVVHLSPVCYIQCRSPARGLRMSPALVIFQEILRIPLTLPSFSAGLGHSSARLRPLHSPYFRMPIVAPPPIAPIEPDIFDDDDDGWQDMPIVREDDLETGLDEEDKKKYHYVTPTKKDLAGGPTANATGQLLDFDYSGTEWRAKADQNESEYTRLRITEEDDSDEVHLRTKYLFDEDKAMTPLSQMQATKDLLTEAQRIAYVGLCALTSLEMVNRLKAVQAKELKNCIQSMELWALKIMGRLYYHMELATEGE